MRNRTANWFLCKIRYEKTMEDGLQKKVTEQYVVNAMSFTEAEARIIDNMKAYINGEFDVDEIDRCVFGEIFFKHLNALRILHAKRPPFGLWSKVHDAIQRKKQYRSNHDHKGKQQLASLKRAPFQQERSKKRPLPHPPAKQQKKERDEQKHGKHPLQDAPGHDRRKRHA